MMKYSVLCSIIAFVLFLLGPPKALVSQKLKHYDEKCFVLNDTIYVAGARKKHSDRIQLFAAAKGAKPKVIFPPEEIYYSGSFYDGLPWALGHTYFFFEARTRVGMQAEQLARAIFFFKRKDIKYLDTISYPEPKSTILSKRHFLFNLIDYQKRKGGLYNRSDIAINQNDEIYYLVNTSKGIQIGRHNGIYWKRADFKDIYKQEEEDQWKILGVMDFEIGKAFRAFILDGQVYVLSVDGIFKASLNNLEAGHKIADLSIKPDKDPLWVIDLEKKTVFIRHATALRNLKSSEVKFIPLSEASTMQKRVNRLCRKK